MTPATPSLIRYNKDPWSAYTHFAGFVAALVGFIILVAFTRHDPTRLVTMGCYGLSLMLLFLASASYHFFDLGLKGNQWLRRLDHSAIFLLIAGTYTPMLVYMLDGPWRVAMLGLVWGLTVVGVSFKLIFYNAAKKAGALMYVILGWLILIPAYKIFPNLSAASLSWLISGGVTYTVGAVVYASKWPNPWPEKFGFHEIWHLFVLAAALMHYFFTFSLMQQEFVPF